MGRRQKGIKRANRKEVRPEGIRKRRGREGQKKGSGEKKEKAQNK